MADPRPDSHRRLPIQRPNGWRAVAWSFAALLLLAPLIAMQVSDDVSWSVADFVGASALILGVGVPLELVVRKTSDRAYRWAAGIALGTAFLLIWLSLGVGLIGADGDPANLLYGGVLAVGVGGGLLSRFRPRGMARAMSATALAQSAIAGGALLAGLGEPYSGALHIVVLNGGFVVLWGASALLFRQATRQASSQPAR